MPSVGTYFAQPVTKSLGVTQGEWGAYFYAAADFDNWSEANSDRVTKVSDSLYVIPGTRPGFTFEDVVEGNNGATEIQHSLSNISERKTLTDMGKQIVIGNGKQSRLLVFRRVQEYVDSALSGDGRVGYVVVENNAADLGGNSGRYTLRVARV